jgi:hypothetical protein
MTGEEGRYLYCLVAADDDAVLDVEGIEGAEPRVVGTGGVAAVVHDRADPYDSDDPARVQRWLLAHQRVVDAATETFGTPLPLRFDTLLTGDDATVRAWLADHSDHVGAELDRLAGHREYRVHVHWDTDAFETEVRETDDRLRELLAKRDAADPGEGFLVEKQADERLRELRRARRGELLDRLVELVGPVAVESELDDDPGSQFEADAGGDADGPPGAHVATLSVLAAQADEGRLGDRLDEFVADPALSVRFTGPWPPYSFAPALGPGGEA